MLLINDSEITAKELCNLFSLDYDKISKDPVFENLKIHTNLRGQKSVNKGVGIKSGFFCKHPETGLDVKIQYAESYSNEKVGDKMVRKYSPSFIYFSGFTQNFKGDIDRAVFFALHPMSTTSPVKIRGNAVKRFEFIDKGARAAKELMNLDNIERALAHARQTPYKSLVILAKGLKLKGDIDNMSEAELRAEVRRFAHQFTDKYIDATEDNSVKVEGKIRDLIDKKVFVLQQKGTLRQWYWNAGQYDGDTIGDSITNRLTDPVESLINYILENATDYVAKLYEVHEGETARSKARSALADIVLPDEEDLSGSSGLIELPMISNHKEVVAFVQEHGYKAIPADVKQLKDAIDSGVVRSDNVLFYMEKNLIAAVEG